MNTHAKALPKGLALLIALILAVACGGDRENPGGFGGGGGERPDPDLAETLMSLPVFPQAAPASLAEGQYQVYNYNDGILFSGFEVSPETTPEDVIGFFAKALPPEGWKEKKPPWTETYPGKPMDLSTGEQLVITSTYYAFLKNNMRLLVEIPIGRGVPKDKDSTPPPPGRVAYVNLVLADKELELFPSPVGTPVESTPPPTAPQKTPDYTAPPLPSYVPTPVTPRP